MSGPCEAICRRRGQRGRPILKPLYIQNERCVRVLLDKPALLVQRDGEADRLYPVRRLSRVVSQIGVQWDYEALAYVVENGVPIVLHDRAGRLVARFLGAAGEPARLVRLLEDMLYWGDGADRYRDWCAHHERQHLFAIANEHDWVGRDLNPTVVQRRILSALERRLEKKTAILSLRYLNTHTHAWVQEKLARLGVDGRTPHLTGGMIDVPADLTRILQWHIMAHWAGQLVSSPDMARIYSKPEHCEHELTRYYQQLEPLLEENGRRLISRLHLWAASTDVR